MAKTRDNYQVTGRTVEELQRSLNFILQRMADRMDKIEGIRGTASIESNLDMNSNRVTEVGAASSGSDAARFGDLLTEPLTVSELTVTGDTTLETLEVNDDVTANGSIEVYDENGALIHSLE
jgi:hypothetical protein